MHCSYLVLRVCLLVSNNLLGISSAERFKFWESERAIPGQNLKSTDISSYKALDSAQLGLISLPIFVPQLAVHDQSLVFRNGFCLKTDNFSIPKSLSSLNIAVWRRSKYILNVSINQVQLLERYKTRGMFLHSHNRVIVNAKLVIKYLWLKVFSRFDCMSLESEASFAI